MSVSDVTTDRRACYRRLRHYKYQLMQDYSIALAAKPSDSFESSYLQLTRGGELTIKQGYAWDGPSGPTFDTRSFMRGSLVHDALYQLMREGCLDYLEDRKYADRLLKILCLEDGMFWFRAGYVYRTLRLFGGRSARPSGRQPVRITCAPA